jgi:hypothetical protein
MNFLQFPDELYSPALPVLGLLALLVQTYLLYWYKSTNTDADKLYSALACAAGKPQVLSLLALLVQKY